MGYSKYILNKILIIQLDEKQKTMNEVEFLQILEKKINKDTFENYAMIIICTKNSKSGTNKHFQHLMKSYLEKNSFTLFSKIDATPYTTINHMMGRANARTRIYVNKDKFVNLMSISSNNNFKKFQNSYDKNKKNKLENLRSELLNSKKKQNILSSAKYNNQKEIDYTKKLYLSGYSINRKTDKTNHNKGFILVAFNFIAEPSFQGAIEYGLIINNNYNVTNSSSIYELFENKFSNILKDDYKKVLNIDYGKKNNSNRKESTKIIRLQLGNNTKIINNSNNINNNNERSSLIRKRNSQNITKNNNSVISNPVHENNYGVMAEKIQYILSIHLFYLFYRKSDGNYIPMSECQLFIYNKTNNNNKSKIKRGIDILLGFYIYYILFHKLLDEEMRKNLIRENFKNTGKKKYHNLFVTMNMNNLHIDHIDKIINDYTLQLHNDDNDIKFLNIIKVINNIKVNNHKIRNLINDLSEIGVFTPNELNSIPKTRIGFTPKNKDNVCETLRNADLEDFFRYGKYNNSIFSSKNIRENFTGKLFKENLDLDSNYCGGKILNKNGKLIPRKPKIETIKELTTEFIKFIKESYTKRYADLIRSHGKKNFKYILA